MTEEKKACPFCGRARAWVLGPTCTKATPYNASDRAFPVVRCRCGAEVPGDDWDKSGQTAIAAWNRRAPDARDARDARIAELEAKLASPSPHDPGQAAIATLRSMGYEHHGGVQWAPPVLEMAVCGCGDEYPANGWDAGFIAALGHCANCAAALDPVTPEPAPSTPWYPDDSGEWVEVPEDLMEMPAELRPSDLVHVMLKDDREKKRQWGCPLSAGGWNWRHPTDYTLRIVAYKVVKP